MALKSLFLLQNCKNPPAAGGSASSVTRLSCIGLFSTEPKLDNFLQRNIYFWFKPLSLSKTPISLRVAFTPANRFFKRLYGPHTKQANKRCRGYTSLFLKDEYKIVALNCQFYLQKFSLFYSASPPIFG